MLLSSPECQDTNPVVLPKFYTKKKNKNKNMKNAL